MQTQTQAIEKLDRYMRARYPIIALVSHEETRVIAAIDGVASRRGRRVATWAITTGWQNCQAIDPQITRDPVPALEAVAAFSPEAEPTLFVAKDLHAYLQDPLVIRYLRDIAAAFEASRHTLVILSPSLKVPAELDKTIVVMDWPLPDGDELGAILRKCEVDLPARIKVTLNGSRENVIQAMRGLTAFEAGSVLLNAIAATGELGDSVIPEIVKEKRQIIRKSGALEIYDTDLTMNDVGGLAHLKAYASRMRAAFTAQAAEAGVDTPKGILLVGVPGTGKSLAAKAIAGGQMPLLRLDFGAIMGGLVGESEGNIREALKIAEAISPCVLWVDEIEKAIGGVESSNQTDGGTMTRVFGTLLTWMQEKTSPVYIVATANDVRSLRSEFLRAGRFDDMFWVDLPCKADRVEVLSLHLGKRKKNPQDYNLEAVADACYGYTGAEIEQVVKVAISTAFYQGNALSTRHLIAAAAEIVPIAQTMQEAIADLRAWGAKKAKPANDPLETRKAAASQGSKAEDL